MASDAGFREELFNLLDERLGTRAAALLMNELPPSGWRDFATKRDVDSLRAELRGELAEFRGEIKEKFASQTQTLIYVNVGAVVAAVGLVIGTLQLA